MKKLIGLLSIMIVLNLAANAQSIFKPLEKPSYKMGAKFGGVSLDSIIKSIRPVAVLSGTASSGAQLAGGAGIGYQSNKWDAASQSWVTQYSVSLVGLLGTNGKKITGTGGVVVGIPGTNGLLGLGGGYDFTQGVWVVITGIQLKFN